jgi:hypothetical protein
MFSPEEIKRLLDIANAGCSTGRVAQARTIYQGILSLKPGFAPAAIGLAFTHIVVDDFAEGERLLREDVLAATPDDEDALVMLSLCYTLAGQREEAAEILKPLTGGVRAELATALLEYSPPA